MEENILSNYRQLWKQSPRWHLLLSNWLGRIHGYPDALNDRQRKESISEVAFQMSVHSVSDRLMMYSCSAWTVLMVWESVFEFVPLLCFESLFVPSVLLKCGDAPALPLQGIVVVSRCTLLLDFHTRSLWMWGGAGRGQAGPDGAGPDGAGPDGAGRGGVPLVRCRVTKTRSFPFSQLA